MMDELIVNVKEYLERIGISEVEAPSQEYLTALMDHHLLSVPFENLDIHQGVEIKLELEHLFEKIVLRRRGGFCYELNGLFAGLLRGLGFEVTMLSARVYLPDSASYTPDFDHMTLLVQLDQPYLVDVGFGDCFRKPLLFSEGSVEDISGVYRIRPCQILQGGFKVERRTGSGWESEYGFDLKSRKLEDFDKMCSYHQTSPDSHFTQDLVCTIATLKGRKTLSQNNLTVTRGQEVEKRPVLGQDHFYQLLDEHFDISL
jgi:N-hydroxyarylamine O-acetyltransferase